MGEGSIIRICARTRGRALSAPRIESGVMLGMASIHGVQRCAEQAVGVLKCHGGYKVTSKGWAGS